VEVIVTLAIVIIVVLLAVLGFGYLIYKLMGRSQEVVPRAADADDAKHERVVGVDEQGAAITEAQEPTAAARDGGAFESLLQDEIHDLGHEQPAADDEA
jgi:hypothetical protein